MDHIFFKQVGKYWIVGFLNTLLAVGILNLLMFLTGIARGWFVDLFLIIAFSVTTTHSFLWNKFWIFNANGSGMAKKEYARFFGISAAMSLLAIFFMHILVNVAGAPRGIGHKIWANISLVLLIPISFLGNFFGYKFFVFKK